MDIDINCWFSSDPGTRDNNEDNYFVQGRKLRILPDKTISGFKKTKSEKSVVFMCADGMGGGIKGEKCAIKTLKTAFKLFKDIISPDKMAEIINYKINKFGRRLPSFCGSTFAAVEFRCDGRSVIAHVFSIGDSPVYHYHDGIFTRLTIDDNYYGRLLADGMAPEDPIEIKDCKRQITRFFGMKGKAAMQEHHILTQKGDYFILASDGASAIVDETDFDISGIIKQENPAAALVNCAVDFNKTTSDGKSDNTTVIILEVL